MELSGTQLGDRVMALPERSRPRWWVWLVAILVAVGAVTALVVATPPLYRFAADQDQLRAWVARLGPWGPLGIVLLEIAQTLFAPVPGQAVGLVSGYLYGPWWGTLYAMAGLVAGSLLAFLLARHLGRPLLKRLVGEGILAQLDGLARRGGALFFLLVWLVPFTPDDIACFAAGLTPISTGQFLLLVVVGRLPSILVSTWLGAHASRLGPAWWAFGILSLAALGAAVWWWRRPLEEALLRLAERLARYRGT